MVYLKQIEAELLNKASDRELALYRFLEGKTHTFIAHENDKEGALCSLSFGNHEGVIELQKLRNTKPIKGMHYSNNMTVLVAAANIDLENELENLEKYIGSHSYRDLFIINTALKSNFSTSIENVESIDQLAQKLLAKTDFSESDIAASLTNIHDLYDLFVVKSAIARVSLIIEGNLDIPRYEQLLKLTSRISHRISSLSYLVLSLVIIVVTYYTLPPIIFYIMNNWDKLEPIAWLLGISVAVLAALGLVLSEKIKLLFIGLKRLTLKVGYWCFGVCNREFISLLDELEKIQK